MKPWIYNTLVILCGLITLLCLTLAVEYFKLVHQDFKSRLLSNDGQELRQFAQQCRERGDRYYTSMKEVGDHWLISCKEFPDETP